MNDAPQQSAPREVAPEPSRRAPGLNAAVPALVVALLAAAAFAWQWHDYRGEMSALRHEVAKKLADTETQSKESRIVSEQVRAAVADAQVKLGVLESRLAESQSQQIALESLYQELS